MSMTSTAARVMSLAQDGHLDAATDLAQAALAQAVHRPRSTLPGLWYAVAVLEHIRGDVEAQQAAADRCLALGVELAEPGWTSNALSMRAMAQVRRGAVEAAVVDLARGEVELAACQDDALRCWAHTGLGYCYENLRLYELALPHLVSAVELDGASPIPLVEAPLIDLMNLVELHLRWADELERVVPLAADPTEVERHHQAAHGYAVRAHRLALELGVDSFVASARWMELCSRATSDAADVVDELRAALALPDHRVHQGGRAQVATALARALWSLGRADEAVVAAREAVAAADGATDWQVVASARWMLVELEASLGVPGAAAGRDYGRLLSSVLWQQRLSTLQGARAALDVERLQRDHQIAVRQAAQDPLTGLGNRRALDEALAAAAVPVEGPQLHRSERRQHSLLLIDLDDFKQVNDAHGHLVGDQVLRSVATALRGAARANDLVIRLGGDEFVVLALGTSAEQVDELARRLGRAVSGLDWSALAPSLLVRASVGVATTGDGVTVDELMQVADVDMYETKPDRRSHGRRARAGGAGRQRYGE